MYVCNAVQQTEKVFCLLKRQKACICIALEDLPCVGMNRKGFLFA